MASEIQKLPILLVLSLDKSLSQSVLSTHLVGTWSMPLGGHTESQDSVRDRSVANGPRY